MGRPPPPDPIPTEDDAAFERPLFEVFAEVATRQPDHLAVDDGVTRLTYAELHERALALGAHLAAVVPAGGPVGVAVPTSVLYPVAWLACLAARRTFLPLDTFLPPARNRAIVAEAGLAAVIVPPATMDVATWLPENLPRIPIAEAPGAEPPPLPSGLPQARVGMVLFTSGSTGQPKGIALHERSALRNVVLKYRAACGVGPGDRLLSLHPPSTFGGAGDTFGALLCGASLHLMDLKRDGLARALVVLRDGMTVCATVPVVVRALMAIEGAAGALGGLRIVRLGGDAVTGSDIDALARLLAPSARIMVGFGMTETGGVVAQRLIDPRAPVETGRVAVGAPLQDQVVSLRDADDNPVMPGEAGRLLVSGRYVALGHWIAGRLDSTAFPSDPTSAARRCYRSGDVVLLRGDGMLVPIGRADRQVKINGMRVEPGDTEATLRGLPGVADAVVLVHGEVGAAMLVACVVAAAGSPPGSHAAQTDGDGVRSWRAALTALLPPQQVPARIRVVPAIPLLPSLKPDLAALRALLSSMEARTTPDGARAHALARVWDWVRGGGLRGSAARVWFATRRDRDAT